MTGGCSEPSYGWYGDDFTGATDTLATLARRGQRGFFSFECRTGSNLAAVGELDAVGIAGAARTMTRPKCRSELTRVGGFFRSRAFVSSTTNAARRSTAPRSVGNIASSDRRPAGIRGPSGSCRWSAVSRPLAATARFPTSSRRRGRRGYFRLDRHPTMSRHPATPMTEADLRRHFADAGLPGVAAIHWPLMAKGMTLSARSGSGYRRGFAGWSCSMRSNITTSKQSVAFVGARAGDVPCLMVGASSVAQACFEDVGIP